MVNGAKRSLRPVGVKNTPAANKRVDVPVIDGMMETHRLKKYISYNK